MDKKNISFKPVGENRLTEWLIVSLLIAIFLVTQLIFPSVPGIIPHSLIYEQHLSAQIIDMLRENSLWDLFISGKLPSQRESYHGVLMAYFYLPFSYLVGPNWDVAKFWYLVVAVPTFIFSYLGVREIAGRAAATLALGLLVIHPDFVGGMRLGWVNHSHLQMFSTGALYFLSRWWNSRRSLFLVLGMLFVGFGISDLLWYYWFIVGLILIGLLYAREIAEREGPELKKIAAVAAAALALGCAPVIYRELSLDFVGARRIAESLWGSANPASPSHYFDNLPIVFRLVWEMMSSQQWRLLRVYADPAFEAGANHAVPVLLIAAMVFLLVKAVRRKEKRLFVFPILMSAMILLAPVSSGTLPTVQLFFLYPFPQFVLATAIVESIILITDRRRALAIVCILLLVGFKEVHGLTRFFFRFKDVRVRGVEPYRELAVWLSARGPERKTVFLPGWEGKGNDVAVYNYFFYPGNKLNYVYVGDTEPAESILKRARSAGTFENVLVIQPAERTGLRELSPFLQEAVDKAIRRSPLATFSADDSPLQLEVYPVTPPDKN